MHRLYAVLWLATALATTVQVCADATPRILAFGDVHGADEALITLLTSNGVIDSDQRWTAGSTTLISLGDLVDRGPGSRRVMDLLMRLQNEAPIAGGEVVVLLGNHEAMNLIGDLRDVSDAEYAAFAADPMPGDATTPDGAPAGFAQHREAFSQTGRYGAWLLSLPAIVKRNRTVFVHGGLHPDAVLQGIAAATAQVRSDLLQLMAARTTNDPIPASLGDAGLLWHRGNTGCHPLYESEALDRALARVDAQRVVVGHTPTPSRTIETRLSGRVIAIDTGMLAEVYRGQAMLLEIADGELKAYDSAGNAAELRAGMRVPMGDAQTEERLFEALSGQRLSAEETEGSTRSSAATTAVVATVDGRVVRGEFVTANRRSIDRAIAAWRLDRQLGLDLVPLTAPAKVGQATGYATFTDGDWFDEAERRQRNVRLPSLCATGHVYDLVRLSDLLFRRASRRPDELSYSNPLGLVRLTGQHATFGVRHSPSSRTELPAIPLTLRRALARWTQASLTADVGDLISRREIRALLARRDALLGSAELVGEADRP